MECLAKYYSLNIDDDISYFIDHDATLFHLCPSTTENGCLTTLGFRIEEQGLLFFFEEQIRLVGPY